MPKVKLPEAALAFLPYLKEGVSREVSDDVLKSKRCYNNHQR